MNQSDQSRDSLNVLFLLPRIHFYAPLAIREAVKVSDHNFFFGITPKFSNPDGSRRGIVDVIGQKGIRYLFSQGSLRALFGLANRAEKVRNRPFKSRLFENPVDCAREWGTEYREVSSIGDEDFLEWSLEPKPDLLFSVFFNQFIPDRLIRVPQYGAFNLHPGPLPEYRGYSPVFWQMLNGASEASVTLHGLTSEIDKGEIVDTRTTEIRSGDSYFSLYRRLARLGGGIIRDVIRNVESGTVPATHPQEGDAMTYESYDRGDVDEFYRQGNRFWTFRDFYRVSERTE